MCKPGTTPNAAPRSAPESPPWILGLGTFVRLARARYSQGKPGDVPKMRRSVTAVRTMNGILYVVRLLSIRDMFRVLEPLEQTIADRRNGQLYKCAPRQAASHRHSLADSHRP
jgi:hypothetical protein